MRSFNIKIFYMLWVYKENVDIHDLLHFRDIHKDSLERFRVEMGKLATEIETNYWDSDFYRKIRDKVDLEIKPAMGLGLYHITCPKTNHHIMSTKELEEKQEEEMR